MPGGHRIPVIPGARPHWHLCLRPGLSLFAVSGALKALEFGGGPAQVVILGAITAVGGGTIRDVLIGRIPVVLRSGLYAIPALVGALVMVVATQLGASDVPAAVGGALVCFAIRMLGVHFGLDAPGPRNWRRPTQSHSD